MSKYKIVSGRTYDNRIHPFVVLGKDKVSSSILCLKISHSKDNRRNYTFKKNPNPKDDSKSYLSLRAEILPYGYWADYSSYEISKEDELKLDSYVKKLKEKNYFEKYLK